MPVIHDCFYWNSSNYFFYLARVYFLFQQPMKYFWSFTFVLHYNLTKYTFLTFAGVEGELQLRPILPSGEW